MADLILPDSNFYIRAARVGSDPFKELLAHVEPWDFATCGMVILEVCRGRSNPNVCRRFRENFAIMRYIQSTSQVWERATQLSWDLDRRGIVLPSPDLFIAACALHANAIVLTHDAHFKQIPGLEVIDHLG